MIHPYDAEEQDERRQKLKGDVLPRVLTAITVVAVVVGLSALAYQLWKLERRVHYSWSYKSMVEQTVRDMVKPEALKKP